MPVTDTSTKIVPGSFLQTQTIAEGALKLGSVALFGRKVILTGYPLNTTSNIYVGYDAGVSATNCAFALRGGDNHVDESSGPWDRRTNGIFYIAVQADNIGLLVGIE